MVLQHNLTAMNSNRLLGLTTSSQAKSTEKLSSGYKINRAADDAAGLSISEKMRKQVRGLTQASANAQDGISAVQTAEGALSEVQDMLQRMNELAVKSANGTMSENDRSYIQNEIDQLTTEIDRVAETTKFNETYLLKGDKDADKVYSFSYGTGIKATITSAALYDAANTTALTADTLTTLLNDDPKAKIYTAPPTAGTSAVPASTMNNILYDVAGNTLTDATLAALLTANSTASVYTAAPTAAVPASVNGNTLYDATGNSLTDATLDALLTASPTALVYTTQPTAGTQATLGVDFNYTAGVSPAAEVATGKIVYVNGADPINAGGDVSQHIKTDGTGDFKADTMYSEAAFSTVTLSTTDDLTSGATTDLWFYNTTDKSVTKIDSGSDLTSYFTGTTGTAVNGVASDYILLSAAQSADVDVTNTGAAGSFTAINSIVDSANAAVTTLSEYEAAVAGGGVYTVAPVAGTAAVAGTDYTAPVAAGTGTLATAGTDYTAPVAAVPGTPGPVATLGTDYTAPQKAGFYDKDGNRIAENALSNHFEYDGTSITQKSGSKLYDAAGDEITVDASVIATQLNATPGDLVGNLTLKLHVGADATENNQISVNLAAMSAKGLGVNSLKVDGANDTNAKNAIDTIKEAIQKVSTQRSALGAAQNRLEHTISNLDSVVENTTAAESQIRDTNMATEMVKFSNNNILAQAGQSMLAQANQSNQGVLSLLR